TTALTTSPFFTPPPGRASLTEPTITSPRLAYRRPDPPSTRMQSTSRAPVLSATRHLVSCWITGRPCPHFARSRTSTTRQRNGFLLDDGFLGHLGERTPLQLAAGDGLAPFLEGLTVGCRHGVHELLLGLARAQGGQDPGDVVTHLLHAHRVVELPHSHLKAQV